MKILSLASFKGGVGKSSLAVNIAGIAAREHGKRVLIVDADENATASNWFRTRKAPFDTSQVNVATDNLLDLRRIKGYDLMVIDLPGHRGQALIDVLQGSLSDLMLIPARANAADMSSLSRLIPVIESDYRIVLNQVTPRHDPDADLYRAELTSHGWKVAEHVVHQSKGWGKAVTESRLVIDGSRFSPARTDARELTSEVLEILK